MNKQTNQEELPLLSVVIWAYNIEKELLDRCVSSAVQQTYTNLEIILINDASTDDTGLFCDLWLEKDNRIQVFHSKKYSDLSESLQYVTGKYIHFLDHDDWIAPDMYAKMMSAMLSTNSDIARCEFCLAYPDGQIVNRNITHHTDSHEIIGREEGVLLILEDKKWQTYIWQNIFKMSLFDNYVDPHKDSLGDLASTHTLYHNALQTVYLHDVFYFYYQRFGSMVNPQNIQKRMYVSYCRGNAHYERYLFVKQYPQYHSMLQSIRREATKHSIFSLWDMIDYPQIFPDNAYDEYIERLKQFPLSLRGKLFVYNLDLLILKTIPRCYKPLYKIFHRNLRRIKTLKRHIK